MHIRFHTGTDTIGVNLYSIPCRDDIINIGNSCYTVVQVSYLPKESMVAIWLECIETPVPNPALTSYEINGTMAVPRADDIINIGSLSNTDRSFRVVSVEWFITPPDAEDEYDTVVLHIGRLNEEDPAIAALNDHGSSIGLAYASAGVSPS